MSNIGNNPISFLFSQLFWSKQSIKKRFLSRIIKLSFFFFVFIFDPSLKLVLEEHATCRLLWHAEHQSIRRADAQFCRSLWRQAATLPLPIYDSAWEWKGIHLQRARTTTNMHRLSRGEKNRTKTEVHIDRLMQEMVLLLFSSWSTKIIPAMWPTSSWSPHLLRAPRTVMAALRWERLSLYLKLHR